MKNVVRSLFVGLVVLSLGFIVVGCDDGSDDNDGGGGILTITNIPSEYNGKYGKFTAGSNDAQSYYYHKAIYCTQSLIYQESVTLSQINNGSITLPTWIQANDGTISSFSGDAVGLVGWLDIYDKKTLYWSNDESEPLKTYYFYSLSFKGGSASISTSMADHES